MLPAALPASSCLAAAGCAAAAADAREPRQRRRRWRRAGPAPNRSFNRQNRYLLSERSTTDSPFSTSGDPAITTRGLTERYDYDTQLASCLAAPEAAGQPSRPGPSDAAALLQGSTVL